MRKIREVLRLRYAAGLSTRQVAASVQLAHSTVVEYARRFAAAGLSWPLPEGLSDTELERRLFPPPPAVPVDTRPLPDWAHLHQELRHRGVTLLLLWQEYQAAHADGYQYSWFCDQYRAWAGKLDLVMRQTHRAGEKLFVDYAGQTIAVMRSAHRGSAHRTDLRRRAGRLELHLRRGDLDPAVWRTGSARTCAPSNSSAACAKLVVPGQLAQRRQQGPPLRAGAQSAPTQEMARHYGVAVLPARARQAPRQGQGRGRRANRRALDPGRAASSHVLLAWRSSTARFANCWECSTAGRSGSCPGSRAGAVRGARSPRPAPVTCHALCVRRRGRRVRVHIDYHVELEGHYYSVPYPLIRREIELRYSGAHGRVLPPGSTRGQPSALPAQGTPHDGHRTHAERASRVRRVDTPAARALGRAHRSRDRRRHRATSWTQRRHPQQGFRSCLGIMRLGKRYGAERLEAACVRALETRRLHLQESRIHAAPGAGKRALATVPGTDHRTRARQRAVAPRTTTDHRRRNHSCCTIPRWRNSCPCACRACTTALTEQMAMPDIAELSFEERLGLLVDRELTARGDKPPAGPPEQGQAQATGLYRGYRLSRPARPRQGASCVNSVSASGFAKGLNVLVTGPTGVGKTWLSCALAHQACRAGLHRRCSCACHACSKPCASLTPTAASPS